MTLPNAPTVCIMQCSYNIGVATANQVAKSENRQHFEHSCSWNTAKVSKHVWTRKKQAAGKLTVEVAKLITSPPVHQVPKCKTRCSMKATRPDSSSGRCCWCCLFRQRTVNTVLTGARCQAGEAFFWNFAWSCRDKRSGHWKPLTDMFFEMWI